MSWRRGFEPTPPSGGSPEELAAFIKADQAVYAKVVKIVGIKKSERTARRDGWRMAELALALAGIAAAAAIITLVLVSVLLARPIPYRRSRAV